MCIRDRKDGEVVQVGTSEEILTEPANDYVARFVENVDRKMCIRDSFTIENTSSNQVFYISESSEVIDCGVGIWFPHYPVD